MPQIRPHAVTGSLLLAVLLLATGGARAGFWQRVDAFFSVPPLDPQYRAILVDEGQAYLQGKDDVFRAGRLLRDAEALAPPAGETLPDGTMLVEFIGFHDVEATAVMAFDNGAGYRYAPGDTLVIRLYTAALVKPGAEGGIDAYRARVVALRNMSNPDQRDGEVGFARELQETAYFSDEDRAQLARNGD